MSTSRRDTASSRGRRAAAIFGLAAALLGCATRGGPRAETPHAVRRASEAVICLTSERRGEHSIGGSAVLLPGGRAITAGHLVAVGERWTLSGPGGVLASGAPPSSTGLLDYVYLPIDPDSTVAVPSDAPARVGQTVYVVARESGLIETEVVHADSEAPMFSFHGGRDGDSGGGVFDPEGRLLGVVVLSGDLTFAISIPWLARHGDAGIPQEADGLDANLLWGVVASRKGLWEDASRLLRAAHGAALREPLVCFLLGRALLATGDVTGAIECFETVVSLSPADTRAWHNLGVCCQRAGRTERAIECYRRALDLSPRDMETLHNLRLAQEEE